MHWLSLDTYLNNSEPASPRQQDQRPRNMQNSSGPQEMRPQKRWGQAAVSAHNRLYIIGGYEGNSAIPHLLLKSLTG